MGENATNRANSLKNCPVKGQSEQTDSRGDRYLGMTAAMTQVPVPTALQYVSHTDGFCATSAVLSRIPRGELAELVCSPVEEYGILDIDADTDKHVSDSEIRAFLLEKQGIANPLMVQSLEKGRRDEVLRSAKLFGAGIRQLSRLTGVSFGVIQKI